MTLRTIFAFWNFPMCLDIDAYIRNQTIHIGTRLDRQPEALQGTSHILHYVRQLPQRQFAFHHECRKLHSGAFCPS